jgi:hypothetical protein
LLDSVREFSQHIADRRFEIREQEEDDRTDRAQRCICGILFCNRRQRYGIGRIRA